ncbi:MAG TPA: DoxX family protein [Actinophytocola sp.]|uniref:DoxX family protein n=1 Tax=Actinophytocola sp. TaxID=1872138 RepID=UPI002DBB2C61|nr:DoxX family protein [Actinophytocola sp.]HEU5470182.1 DoxX family protein [Actinophytocola sp.]
MTEQERAVRVGDIAAWVLQVALAAYFVYSAFSLFGDDFVKKFEEIGLGQWLRYLTGALELAGAIGLLIPPLCGLAALGLVGIMVGAIGTELFLLDNGDAKLPFLLLILAAVVAWYRWDTVRTLPRVLSRS